MTIPVVRGNIYIYFCSIFIKSYPNIPNFSKSQKYQILTNFKKFFSFKSAQLFLFGWVKEVKAVIKDRDLTDSKSIQLGREFTEGKARQQVDFFLDTSPITTPEALLEHLLAAFASGEDEAAIKSEFYGREQFSKESEDDFTEALQLLSRKILMVNPNFRAECNSALINQFASSLHDNIM